MVVLLDVAVFSLSVLTPNEVEAAGSSTSPPVTAGKTDYGLDDKSDDWVGEVVHCLRGSVCPAHERVCASNYVSSRDRPYIKDQRGSR